MKGISSTFMGWTVLCPQWNSMGDLRKLDFDEGVEGPVLPRSPLWSMGSWPAPQSGPLPWHQFISTMVTSARMRKEALWLLPSLPLWLWIRQQARSTPLPQEEGGANALLCKAAHSSPLHGALIFKAPTAKGVGDIPMELAVPSFFFLLKR